MKPTLWYFTRTYLADLRIVLRPLDKLIVCTMTATNIGLGVAVIMSPSMTGVLLFATSLVGLFVITEMLRVASHHKPLFTPDERDEFEACKRRHPSTRDKK